MPTHPLAERSLRLLHIEDSDLDHQLILAQLQRAGLRFEITRLDTLPDIEAALDQTWDAVISDYNLPGFSGLVVLDMLKQRHLVLPFVLVSGEIGEDTAVAAMRTGASDYLLKNNLARLAPALLHAIESCEAQLARQEADRELLKSKQQLHELAGHLQTSVEMERAAIAREIHDDVGGSLTALKFDLAWIARHSRDEDVQQRVQSALETVTSAIESSQRIMHNLRPAILEQGLLAAVQWLAARFERRTGIATAVRHVGEQFQLPAGVPLVAYRCAQEALTNVSKHGDQGRRGVEHGGRRTDAGNQGQRSRRRAGRSEQGAQLRHPGTAGAGGDGRGLGRPQQRPAGHGADPVGAVARRVRRLRRRRRRGSDAGRCRS